MDNMNEEKTILLTENGTGNGINDVTSNGYPPKTPIWKSKMFLIITGICIVAVIAIITTVVLIAGNGKSDIEKRLETANRYLLELDYEQAIAEFEKIIESDPKCAEAYIGLAKAYEGLGDTEKAKEVLKEGYEKTKSEKIKSESDNRLLGNNDEEITGETYGDKETDEVESKEVTTEPATTTAENTSETTEQTTSQEMTTEQQTTTAQETTTEQVTINTAVSMRDEILIAAKDVYKSFPLEYVFFYDFNLDGIPEMCLGEYASYGMFYCYFYSYNGKEFVEVSMPWDDLAIRPAALTTYKNSEGKNITVFENYIVVGSEGYGGVFSIDWPDKIVCIGRTSAVFGNTTTYKYYDADDNEITEEQYNSLINIALAGYTEVERLDENGVIPVAGDINSAFENAYNIFMQ